MPKMLKNTLVVLMAICFFSCDGSAQQKETQNVSRPLTSIYASGIEVGADDIVAVSDRLRGKRIALVANATSMIGEEHLVDVLLGKGFDIIKVFAPEHGFRGEADAGEFVADEVDTRTGLPVISLYGKNKKPDADQLDDVDLLVFDIQDVGVRFYTYLSTLHYIMEAGAENGIPVMVLDRPNPNGFYVDGPVLKSGFESFVGLHPVPLVYGMTIGEYALMINGESWLKDGVKCELDIVPCKNYTHQSLYELPVRPSPNLPNMSSIYLYPSLALFEGTVVSVGRGTEFPFQVVGHPEFSSGPFTFTPEPNGGAARPKLQGETCKGLDLREYGTFYSRQRKGIYLFWLKGFYEAISDKEDFFISTGFFDKLAGNDLLKAQIESGMSLKEIRASWRSDLEEFMKVREKYLIYD